MAVHGSAGETKTYDPGAMTACTSLCAEPTAPEPEMRRLILPLNSLSRKSSDSEDEVDIAGLGGSRPGGGWPFVYWCGPVNDSVVNFRGSRRG